MSTEKLTCQKPEKVPGEDGAPVESLGIQHANAILSEQSALLLTLQKEVEALREREGFYRDLFEESPAGYLTVSNDGFIQRLNRTAAQMLGYSADELIGRPILGIHPDCLKTKAKVQEVAAVLQSGKKVFEEETEMQCKDGTRIWVNLSLHPMQDAEGHIQRVHAIMSDITERKQAEAKLKKSEAFLIEAQRMARLGNWEWNHSTGEVICSDEVYRIFGFQPGESGLPPSSFFKSVYPDDREYVEKSFLGALHEGKPYDIDHCIVLPDGEVRIVHTRGKAFSDGSGRSVRVSGTVQDITDRRQAEERLAESERLYSTMSNSSPIGVYIVQDGKFVFVNQQFCKMTGFSKHELCGLESLSLVHPEDREMVKEKAVRMLKGQVSSGYEFRAVIKNGETRAILETVASIQYRGKRASLGNYMDITERKQAEEKILLRNRELICLNEIAAIVSQSNDLNRTLNKALARIMEILGMDFGAVVVIDANDVQSVKISIGFSPEFRGKDADVNMVGGLGVIIAKSGKSIFVEDLSTDPRVVKKNDIKNEGVKAFAGVPLKAADKGFGLLCVMSRKSRQVSASDMQLLETIGSQLGMAIDNARLVEDASKTRALEELDRLRTELLASVSHELRTPLTAIKGLASTLIQPDVKWDDETQKDFLEVINKEADILTHLVNDLLEMSQLETGVTRLERTRTRVSSLISQLDSKLKRLVGKHEFEINIPADLPFLYVDEVRIGQVINNLVENAAAYSEEGTRITLEAVKTNREIVISVIDEGVGIPAEHLEKVFDRFYRLESGVARRRGGSGLGLAISKRLVESHGGRIWAESKIGRGSKFSFALPVSAPNSRRVKLKKDSLKPES